MPLLNQLAPRLNIPSLEPLKAYSLHSLLSLNELTPKTAKESSRLLSERARNRREQRQFVIDALKNVTDLEATILRNLWTFWARPEQLLPAPDANGACKWATWLIMAGRGWGKTQTGAQSIRRLVEDYGYHRIALIGDTAAEVRDVMIEGPSGLLNSCPPWFKPTYTPSKRQVKWPNGAVALAFSAEEYESLRGPQFDCAWLDELAKWRYADDAFDQLQFGLRLGRRPVQIITTTPRPVPIIKRLLGMETTFVTAGRTHDNLVNLAAGFRETIIGRYEGTRLGRQELDAELLDDNPDALWSHKGIDKYRVKTLEGIHLERTVVAVDPPATTSGRAGIVAAGRVGSHGYLLRDASVEGRSPAEWGARAIATYYEFEADAIVVEINNGGDMVANVIRNIDASVPIREVRAYKGKWLRAEPVANLYEQGKVHHVGVWAELEDQMVQLTPENLARGLSPDNLDAMVWAFTDLMLKPTRDPKARSL
jgi:phage terminase large subunit-like protein